MFLDLRLFALSALPYVQYNMYLLVPFVLTRASPLFFVAHKRSGVLCIAQMLHANGMIFATGIDLTQESERQICQNFLTPLHQISNYK